MDEKISTIKTWLGTGSINIFGLPMSGKDTQGIRLAEELGAKFISSGMILRAHEKEIKKSLTEAGELAPSDVFFEVVLPYLRRQDLATYPLILDGIGRWKGEEDLVMDTAAETGHGIKVAVLFNISEASVEQRFEAAKTLGDRGDRKDDSDISIFRKRIEEFRAKTMPVLEHYHELGLLLTVHGDQTRNAVHDEMVEKIYQFATKSDQHQTAS